MDNSYKSFNNITSHIILVFPPETIQNNKLFCRFEPDGIALINGYLKNKGVRFVDLVYVPVTPLIDKMGSINEKSFGWAISEFDQEGISLKAVVNKSLTENLNSSLALLLKNLLPITSLPQTKIIGFSIGFPSQFYHSLILARIIKQLNPNLFVVFGGPMITSFITFIKTLKEITLVVDGIIPGYGEEPLAQLILCLEENRDLRNVPNLYLSSNNCFEASNMIWNPDKSNLQILPDYNGATLSRKFDPYFPVRPSIGCYWGRCTFCVYPSMTIGTMKKFPYIILKPEELVNHIKKMIDMGSGDKFELCSDSLPPAYLQSFSEELIKSKIKIKWSAWSCVDKRFADQGVLEAMKQSGCEWVLMGVESVNKRILKNMGKMQTKEDIDLVLNSFFSSNIGLFLTLFVGFPSETKEEALETIHYLKNLIDKKKVNRMEVRLYRFALMGNTPIAHNYTRYGISSVDWTDMYYLDDDFSYRYEVMEGMNFKEIKDFVSSWRIQLRLKTNDSPVI